MRVDNFSTKEILQEVWAHVLKDVPSSFSGDDSFFEVGGDSILAQQLMVTANRRRLGLSVKDIFLNSSLDEMAEIAESHRNDGIEVKAVSEHRPIPLHSDSNSLQSIQNSLAKTYNLKPESIEDAYACSPMQESLVTELGRGENLYVRQLVFRMSSHTSLDCFSQAWQDTVLLNPILRTRMFNAKESTRLVQVIMGEGPLLSTVYANLTAYLEDDSMISMQLGDVMVRAAVVLDDSGGGQVERYFVWTIHHAICDGASIAEVLNDLAARYESLPSDQRQPFHLFIDHLTDIRNPELEAPFWLKTLSSINPTPFPARSLDPEFQVDLSSATDASIYLDSIHSLNITKALFLRAAWAILLSHYTGSEDVGFGTISSGRASAMPGISTVTGPTINLLPIALRIQPRQSIASFMSDIRTQAADMIPFESSGLAAIRKYVSNEHSTAVDFQTLFVVESHSLSQTASQALEALGLDYLDQVGKVESHPYPLVITLIIIDDHTLKMSVRHDERVIRPGEVDRLIGHFQEILHQLGQAEPESLVESILPFNQADMTQIRKWNMCTPPSEMTCIHDLFQEQAQRRPEAIAVHSLRKSFTYREVDLLSSELAARLVSLGTHSGSFIGVCFEKSVYTVIAILAVFKAGNIYVPIDPAHPRSRIAEVVAMASIQFTIASDSSAHVLDGLGVHTTVIDHPRIPLTKVSTSRASSPKDTAYLLFTSGSTGKPKGILMSHEAICTSIIHHGTAFEAGPNWRTLQFGAHTFDLSIAEFFTTLAFGGCICVPSEHDRLNDLSGAITALKANTLLVVPTVANLVSPERAVTLERIVLAGEPITKETLTKWAKHVDLTAAYGPSETAVYCSGNLKVSVDAHPANIGLGIGASMWIVNPSNYHQLSAIGCIGEIVISGALLGQGYLHDRVLTEASFVPAPEWMKLVDPSSQSQMLYRSGDLARYNPDGTFHIVGRRDAQVKLRGFRIELGEIENQIMTHGASRAAIAVLPTKGLCARRIVAIISFNTPDIGSHGDFTFNLSGEMRCGNPSGLLAEVKRHIMLSLPEQSNPSLWVVLERMPLLISGKVDRKAIKLWLEDIGGDTYRQIIALDDALDDEPISPGSVEDYIRCLWSEVLKVPVEHIRRSTSFFALGGDSISAIQVAAKAKEIALPITVRAIIGTNTLDALASFISQKHEAEQAMSRHLIEPSEQERNAQAYERSIKILLQQYPRVEVVDAYPLSPMQNEMQKQRAANPNTFIFTWKMEVSSSLEPLSMDRLVRSWQRVVQRFPILRTKFTNQSASQSSPFQVVLLNAQPEVASLTDALTGLDMKHQADGSLSIDGCLLPHRARFCQYGNRHFLHLELDHAVIDGWSLSLIKQTFLEAYIADYAYRPAQPPSFKAFIDAHRLDRVAADVLYWTSVLRDQKPSLLSFPVGSGHDIRRTKGEKAIIDLSPLAAGNLAGFCSENNVTIASIFDAAWAKTLSMYTESSDVAFEYVVSGRDEDVPGVFDIVGPLINVLTYHLHGISTNRDRIDLALLAQQIQSQRSQDSEHTACNIREVIEQRTPSSMLFNTAVNFNRQSAAVEVDHLKIVDDVKNSRDPWHFDVLVRILHLDDDDVLRLSVEFDAGQFEQNSMAEVAKDFRERIEAITT